MLFREDIENIDISMQSPPKERKQEESSLPLPRGNSFYARGKRAEFAKDIEQAKYYYTQAIRKGDRLLSAVKDLSCILHQEHRTEEACNLLLAHKHRFRNVKKFENLYNTLASQIQPTKHSLKRILCVKPLSDNNSTLIDSCLFADPSRILNVEYEGNNALFHFISHSAARKTLETFQHWDNFDVFWMSIDRTVVVDAAYGPYLRKKQEEIPGLFRDPSENTAVLLLGKNLYETL